MSEQTAGDSANVRQIIASDHGGRIDVPGDPAALLRADFVRDGADLIIVGPEGPIAEIVGYFSGGTSPDLNMGVAVLPARTISILAGPDADGSALTPTPVAATARTPETAQTAPDDQAARIRPETDEAQAADPDAESAPIATVEDMTGEVWVIRFDGSRVALEIGMPVYQEDTVITGEQATVGLRFVDDMSFSLGNDARMVLEEFHYEPDTGDGGGLISVVQGAFSFVSGRAAKAHEDALQIEMPTMTIGVRGTKVAGFAAAEGEKSRVALLAEDDGTVGKIMVSTDGGSYLITDANTMVESISRYMEPLPPVQISTDVMHDYFSSALTILPTAAPKPGQETKLQQLDFDSLNDAATDARASVKKASFDEMAPEAVPVKAAAEAAPAATQAPAPKPKPVAETAPAEATKPAAAAVVSNTTEEEEELVEETDSEESSSAPSAPPPLANAAPVLDTTGAPALAAIVEDTAAPAGTIVSNLVIDGSITDPDGAAVEAIAVVGADNANGSWQYSLDDGATYQAVGAVAPRSALLLDGDALLRFVPSADYNGSATFSYKAWDKSAGVNGDTGVDTTVGTAYSSATETASITVTSVNDKPVLDTSGAPTLTAIAEDAAAPAGETVASLVTGTITDADGVPVEAIAVTGVDDANGTWQYSLDAGLNYSAIGAVSETASLLLGPTALLRFVPDSDYNGTATVSYKAWDMAVGASGDSGVNSQAGTSFSVATETASITVTPANDAPVLDTSGMPTLSAIVENTASPAGNTVASIVVDGSVTDADGTAAEAIAITAVDDLNGTWQYSLDGGATFAAIGPVTPATALLLDATALVRFVPNASYNGTATMSYKAWDMSVGASGDTAVNTLVGSAFSAATETASITIDPGNNAPDLDTSGSPTLTAVAEDTAAPAGDTVAAIVVDGSITDPDGAAVEAIAVTAVDDSNGTWEYSIDGGATFSAIGAVDPTSALLLAGTAVIRFVPDGDYNGGATFSYKAWDMSAGTSGDTGVDTSIGSAFSNEVETASVTVTAVNDAPVLDISGAPTLSAIAENNATSSGNTVASIVIDGSITDVDGAVEAIAVTGVDDNNGTWEYSLDGGATFTAFGAVSDNGALLLDGTAVIRYVPDADYDGTATFSFRAWDGSTGSSGDSGVDTTVGTAFSAAVESASITVTSSSGAPDFTSGREFQVNTFTTDAQSSATAAALGDGGYVIVWESKAQDGDDFGVYAQRYDAQGAAVGAEFRVNTTTTKAQQSPSVTELADGGFVVVWQSMDQDGSTWGVYGQRFDSDGTAVGSEFQINSTTISEQQNPSVTVLADGGFVVVWESMSQDGDNWGVYGQKYSAAGAVSGSEFRINTTTAKEQMNAEITALADGGFVVVWQSKQQDGSQFGTFAQRFVADGTKSDAEFQVNTYSSFDQMEPAVAALADGGFVVVWQSKQQDGGSEGVYGQRYDSSGNAVEFEFRANTTTAQKQEMPSVIALDDGGFLVTWQSDGQDGSGNGIYAQRFNADGDAIGSEFRVNSTTADEQTAPTTITLDNGAVVAVWQSANQDGSGSGIYAHHYQPEAASANGAPIKAGASMLDFDGFNEYVDVGDPGGDDLDLKTGDLTVEAWFYYGGPSSGDQMIVSKGNDWHGDMGFSIHLNNGDLIARVNAGGTTSATDTAATSIAMPAEAGWYHVAMVVDQEAGASASAVTGYLNGSNTGWSSGSGSVSNDIFTAQSGGTDTVDNFVIGAVDTGILRSEHFDGQIADVRVWNTARSQADIQADMGRALNGDEANLIGNWKLDDGAGTTAANAVAGGASGTIYGGAGWQSTTSYTMSVNGELDGRVTANDADGDTLSFSVGTGPNNGTASINATTGAWEYTPNAGYSGTDSVSFQITDGSETDIVTVAIQIA